MVTVACFNFPVCLQFLNRKFAFHILNRKFASLLNWNIVAVGLVQSKSRMRKKGQVSVWKPFPGFLDRGNVSFLAATISC